MALAAALILLLIGARGGGPGWAETGADVLIDDGGLRVELLSAEASPGAAVLRVRLFSDADAALLTLLDPWVNGAPAGLSDGWGSEFIDLTAPGGDTAEIRLVTDDPDEVPETLSLRFQRDGVVSSPAQITLSQAGAAVRKASFEPQEEPLVAPIAWEAGAADCGWTIVDDAPPQGYGSATARVCLRTALGDEQLCAVEAYPGEDGGVYAGYSGLSLTAAGAIVSTRERSDSAIRTEGLTLTAQWIFSAELTATLRIGVEAAELSIVSAELEEPISACPRAAFDTLLLRRNVWEARESADGLRLVGLDSVFGETALRAPLELRAVPVRSLGEIAVYVEYEFADGSLIAHRVE